MGIDELRKWAKDMAADAKHVISEVDDDEFHAELFGILEAAEELVEQCNEREPEELDFG